MHHVEANGARIPALGFGTWELRDGTAVRMVEYALAIGYRHIDTARMYENEREVGSAIRCACIPRDELFVTTKIWPDCFRRGDLEAAAEDSRERLGLEHVDLILLHWPNPEVPLAETVDALNEVRARGITRHIGVSNFPSNLLMEAVRLSEAPLVTDQVEYHPYLSQRRLLAVCRDMGIALTAYCPLARGRVLGDPVLGRIAAVHRKSPAQVALRWLIQQEGVVAIPRSAKPEHARHNFEIWDFSLSEREMEEIHALARPDGRIVDLPGLSPTWDPE